MNNIFDKYPLQMASPPKRRYKREGIKPNKDEPLNNECAYFYELASKATPEEQSMIALMPTLLRMAESCYRLKKYTNSKRIKV